MPNEKRFVSLESESDDVRRRNLYILTGILGFVWIFFHFLVIYFFGLVLESITLVGLFLGFGNLVSFLSDIPIGVLQKYFSARFMFLVAAASILLASAIFLKFIAVTPATLPGGSLFSSVLQFFLNDFLNIVLIVVAAGLYGLTKEINDVTILTYILNNSDPSEYADIISRNNLALGIGSFFGLIVSGALIPFNTLVSVLALICCIVVLIVFLVRFFDNPSQTVRLSDITRLKLVVERESVEKMREFVVEKVQKADFASLVKQSSNLVFLRPLETKKYVDFSDVVRTTRREFETAFRVMFTRPLRMTLLWVFGVILCFAFWDTFVATFQIDFLNKLFEINRDNPLVRSQLISAYVFLGIVVAPVFLTQSLFIRLSRSIGTYVTICIGIGLSSLSIFFFGSSSMLGLTLFFGFLNSFGFAAAMPLAQASFLDVYNRTYAERFGLKEIDSNASAAPLKMVLNFGNVAGLVIGGFVVGLLGFNGFFFLFSLLLLALLVITILRRREIEL